MNVFYAYEPPWLREFSTWWAALKGDSVNCPITDTGGDLEPCDVVDDWLNCPSDP